MPNLLVWNTGDHYSPTQLPCRICGRPAHCRDDDGRPCHKVCAEAALETT